MDNKIQLCTSTNQNKLGPLKNYIGCIINCKRTLIYFDTCSDRFWRNKNRLKLDFRNVCQKNQTYNRIAFIPPTTHKKNKESIQTKLSKTLDLQDFSNFHIFLESFSPHKSEAQKERNISESPEGHTDKWLAGTAPVI